MKKVKFADCTRHLYVPKLNTINKIAKYGLRSWLAKSENFQIISSNDNWVEICYYVESEILEALASDISRLSCAFLESVANVSESIITNKFVAWNLVQYYYAAFYSAHSILKILDFGLIQLDSEIINSLTRRGLASSISLSSKITKGVYCVNIDVYHNKIMLYKINRYDDSHRGLWKRFVEVLGILTGENVSTGTYGNECIRLKEPDDKHPLSIFDKVPYMDALDAECRLSELRNIINRRGDSNWLSNVRNEINYSHGLGSWYPYKDISQHYEMVADFKNACFDNFLHDLFNQDEDESMIKFIKCSQLINSLNWDILKDLQERNPEGKSFLDQYVFRYKNISIIH